MKIVEITYHDGYQTRTSINGTMESIREYFKDAWINFGDTEEYPKDLMRRVVKVEEITGE